MTAKSKKPKIIIVMPAYNVERTLTKVYKDIPKKQVYKILLINNCSSDKTVELAKKLGIPTIMQPKNMGYGGNQKTGYLNALEEGADYIIMLHTDGQYDPSDLPTFINKLKEKKYDLILGSRFLAHGHHHTPVYKSISIRLITLAFNFVLGTKISEVNTGYRAFSRKLLESIPYLKNGNGYIFDPQLIIQTVHFGFKIGEVPIIKDYNPHSSSPNFRASVIHGLENIYLLGQYFLHRQKIKNAYFLTS